MEWKYLLILLLGITGLFLIIPAILKPVRILLKLILCFVIGTILILVVNIFLGVFGMHIPINLVTILLAGVLHVPGVILLVILSYLFV